jgi:hypothetical protein
VVEELTPDPAILLKLAKTQMPFLRYKGDRGIFRALLGVDRDRIGFTVEKSLAAGDDCCLGVFRLV